MVFWVLFSVWLVGVLLPLGVKLVEPGLEWKWIMLWEFLMFLPIIVAGVVAFGFTLLVFFVGRGVKVKDSQKIRDMYMPKWR